MDIKKLKKDGIKDGHYLFKEKGVLKRKNDIHTLD